MTETLKMINFRYNETRWHVVKLIASRLMCADDSGEIRPCTASDVCREMLDLWLSEKSAEFFPRILADFKKQGVESKTTEFLREEIRLYQEAKEQEGK